MLSEDRRAVLAEFARVASGGVVMSFYRFRGLHALQRRLRRLFKPSHRDIRMVAGETFEREAAEAGFVIDRIYPLFRGIHAQHIVVLRRGQVSTFQLLADKASKRKVEKLRPDPSLVYNHSEDAMNTRENRVPGFPRGPVVVLSWRRSPSGLRWAQEKPAPTFKILVTAEQANIRDTPDIGSPIVQQLPEGSILEAEKKQGEWYLVRFTRDDGLVARGYIHESLVRELEAVPAMPVEEVRREPVKKVEEKPEPVAVEPARREPERAEDRPEPPRPGAPARRPPRSPRPRPSGSRSSPAPISRRSATSTPAPEAWPIITAQSLGHHRNGRRRGTPSDLYPGRRRSPTA